MNGDFARYKQEAMAYAWFHWIKDRHEKCTVKWL